MKAPRSHGPILVVFLDVDGVLNSIETFTARERARKEGPVDTDEGHQIDRGLVARLNTLLELTGAKVVVSSTWRMGRTTAELQKLLESRGFRGEVIGVTPIHYNEGRERGHEIQEWLERSRTHVHSFVILDDDSDMAHLRHRLVQTTVQTGLQDHHISMATTILRRLVRQRRPVR
jgi:hypothetical protein